MVETAWRKEEGTKEGKEDRRESGGERGGGAGRDEEGVEGTARSRSEISLLCAVSRDGSVPSSPLQPRQPPCSSARIRSVTCAPQASNKHAHALPELIELLFDGLRDAREDRQK
jgi:hypothetical protein